MSDIFLSNENKKLPGTVITATIEGSSTILLEIQALTSHSYYNMPRRVANGIDVNRLNMIIAVLEKRCNLSLGSLDIYVNVIGGIKIDEPAVDLALAIAIVSSFKNIVIDNRSVFIGEIGLTGEIRGINNIEKRVKEVEKLGYNKLYSCRKQINKFFKDNKINNLELIPCDTIDQVISMFLVD